MKRIFLRHGSYQHDLPHKVLDAGGLNLAACAGTELFAFAGRDTTTILVSPTDRTIETALFLVMDEAAARDQIAGMRDAAEGTGGSARYACLGLATPARLTVCRCHIEQELPEEYAKFQGDLIVVGHDPAAEKLGLRLRPGQHAEF